MKQRITAFFLALFLLFSIAVPAVNAAKFPDVFGVEDQETYNAIMFVSDNGYMVGDDYGKFNPTANLTRAEFAQLLYNYSGEIRTKFDKLPFVDVPDTLWCYTAVSWAYYNGIVKGVNDKEFRPNEPLTKQAMLIMLYRYMTEYQYRSFGTIPETKVIDSGEIWDSAKTAMNWGMYYGIIKRNLSLQIKPKQTVTRQDAALYLCRLENNVVGLTRDKRLSFAHTEANFYDSSIAAAKRNYTISDKLYTRMKHQMGDKYGYDSWTHQQVMEEIQKAQAGKFQGACAGNAMVMILDMLGSIDFNRFVGNYTSVSKVPYPKNSQAVRDAIFYYQLAMVVLRDSFVKQYDATPAGFRSAMAALETEVRTNGATYFGYAWPEMVAEGRGEAYGHAVVVTAVKKINNNEYKLTFVESGSTTTENIFKIDEQKSIGKQKGIVTLHKNNGNNGIFILSDTIRYIPKSKMLEISRFLDLDGDYNTDTYKSVHGQAVQDEPKRVVERLLPEDGFADVEPQEEFSLENRTWILVNAPCRLSTASNLTGTVGGIETTGNLPIVESWLIPYGEDAPAKTSVILEGEEALTISVERDREFSVSASNSRWNANISGNHPVTAHYSEEGILIETAEPTQIELLFHDGKHMLTLSGTVDEAMTLSKRGERYELRGMRGEGTVSCENTETHTTVFSNTYHETEERDVCLTMADDSFTIRNLEEDTQ